MLVLEPIFEADLPSELDNGMRRWVGWGVIGDNLLTIGNAMAKNRLAGHSSQTAPIFRPARRPSWRALLCKSPGRYLHKKSSAPW